MAAGLGFIEFSTGDVLSAAAANGYLASQTVMVFASSAARASAITSPQEGMFSFLKDTNATQFYDGAAWTNLDTTGMVNPMTTTGDTIYSSSGTTPARLGIGTAGQVLTVNSGATAPEWATATGGGGMTLISTTALTGASITLSSIPGTYTNLYLLLKGVYLATVGSCTMQFNADTGSNYSYSYVRYRDATVGVGYNQGFSNIGGLFEAQTATTATKLANCEIVLPRYTDTDTQPVYSRSYGSTATATVYFNMVGSYDNSAAITSIKLTPDYNFSGGTAYLYGVK
jgi:hypothetical protein